LRSVDWLLAICHLNGLALEDAIIGCWANHRAMAFRS
jgi:hypothetical protein